MSRDSIILPYEALGVEGLTSITVPLGFEASCTTSEQVGDLVIMSLTTDNTVERLTSNSYDVRLCVGIINEKPSTTTAIVIVLGVVTGLATGLERGKAVFVGADGKPSTAVPVADHRQIIGMAINSTDFVVNIEPNKVILS